MPEKELDSIATVQIKPDYAVSEVYSTTSEPPPAYKNQSITVKIARIIAFTTVASIFIIGLFILATRYLQARTAYDQLQALDSVLEKTLLLETLQHSSDKIPRADALQAENKEDIFSGEPNKNKLLSNEDDENDEISSEKLENVKEKNNATFNESSPTRLEIKKGIENEFPTQHDIIGMLTAFMENNESKEKDSTLVVHPVSVPFWRHAVLPSPQLREISPTYTPQNIPLQILNHAMRFPRLTQNLQVPQSKAQLRIEIQKMPVVAFHSHKDVPHLLPLQTQTNNKLSKVEVEDIPSDVNLQNAPFIYRKFETVGHKPVEITAFSLSDVLSRKKDIQPQLLKQWQEPPRLQENDNPLTQDPLKIGYSTYGRSVVIPDIRNDVSDSKIPHYMQHGSMEE